MLTLGKTLAEMRPGNVHQLSSFKVIRKPRMGRLIGVIGLRHNLCYLIDHLSVQSAVQSTVHPFGYCRNRNLRRLTCSSLKACMSEEPRHIER